MYFRWVDDNGDDTSPDQNFAIDNVSVQRVNNAPVLAGIEVAALNYIENAAATPRPPASIVGDADNANLAGATGGDLVQFRGRSGHARLHEPERDQRQLERGDRRADAERIESVCAITRPRCAR